MSQANACVQVENSIVSSIDVLLKMLFSNENAVQVTEELYDHFENVLPPLSMGSDWYTFQEGCGEVLYFFRSGREFKCALKSALLISDDYLTHVSIKRDNVNDPFKIIAMWHLESEDGDAQDVPDFIGLSAAHPEAYSKLMKINFKSL